jgi:hypothetical protein
MLRYAGYELKITQSIVRDCSDLPSDLRCAFDVILNVDETVKYRQITPTNIHMDIDISSLCVNDKISVRVDSNINMSYWILVVVKQINYLNTNEITDGHIVPMVGDLIRENIKQLYIPEYKGTLDNIAPGYNYVLYRTINPWIKSHPLILVDRGEVTTVPQVDDWQFVIHYVQTNEYVVAVRTGADYYRTARHYDRVFNDFVDLFKCLCMDD